MLLLAELSAHVIKVVGLTGAAARHAAEQLQRVVRDRLTAGVSVEIAFERRAGDPGVRVAVTSGGRDAGGPREAVEQFSWSAGRVS